MKKKQIKKSDPKGTLEAIAKDRVVRQAVMRESHLMFFHVYFSHYVKYPIAEFQKDIFRITEDQSNRLACIVAFRGSAKSTIVTLSYSLWAILGIQQKKFVLIVCQTQAQARQQMANIRRELENNRLLRSDLGPFREESAGEWAMSSIVFSNMNARIMVASVDQSIRGVRHYEHRPDLIILDDVEDLSSCKTLEGRNKTFDWFTREIVPLGDIGTRIILVGNLLHEDSLMMRLKDRIVSGDIRGVFRWFPLLDEDGACLWPGKFDNNERIEELRRSVGNELAWQQEYLLRIISDATKVVWPDWIHYYDEIDAPEGKFRYVGIGVDLAISERATADYTAVVCAKVYGRLDDMKVFILPNPVNERMPFPIAIERIQSVVDVHGKYKTKLFIEDIGFQSAYVQELEKRGYAAEGVKFHGADKRSRLALTSNLIRDGIIRFPRHGAEDLVCQLVGFGIERHDDLVDAFTNLILKVKDHDEAAASIHFLVEDAWGDLEWRSVELG